MGLVLLQLRGKVHHAADVWQLGGSLGDASSSVEYVCWVGWFFIQWVGSSRATEWLRIPLPGCCKGDRVRRFLVVGRVSGWGSLIVVD